MLSLSLTGGVGGVVDDALPAALERVMMHRLRVDHGRRGVRPLFTNYSLRQSIIHRGTAMPQFGRSLRTTAATEPRLKRPHS